MLANKNQMIHREIGILERQGLTTSDAQSVIEARELARVQIFKGLANHAWYGKQFKKLTQEDVDAALSFIKDRGFLRSNDFETEVNRMFIDNYKTKNWKLVMELLSATNTQAGV